MYSIQSFSAFYKDLTRNGFPWASKTVKPDEHIQRFLDYEPIVKRGKYKLHSYFPKCRYYLPPLFQGQSVTIGSTFENLFQVDNLTDYWTEKVRLQTRKVEEKVYPLAMIDSDLTKEKILATLRKENPSLKECDANQVRQVYSFVLHEAKNFRLTWIKGILSAVEGLDYWKGKRWLDISTGYGDRLLAANLLGFDSYTGFDPNTKLVEPIDKMVKFLEERNPKTKEKFKSVCLPFEESEKILEKEEKFDLVLSSPPFFNAEIYSKEDSQSIERHNKFESWMKNFLFKSIEISWKHLKQGGYLILYVGDPKFVKGGMAEPMNLFIEEFPDASYEGVLGIENDVGIARPCWIWKKGEEKSRNLWRPNVTRSLKNDYPELI